MGCRLRVKTGPECPEDNLRELTGDSNPDCGIDRERKTKIKKRENFPSKAQPKAQLDMLIEQRTERVPEENWLAADQRIPRQRQAGDSQSQKAGGGGAGGGGRNLGPRDSMPRQTVSRLPVANQVFLGSYTVDICQECLSQRPVPQKR